MTREELFAMSDEEFQNYLESKYIDIFQSLTDDEFERLSLIEIKLPEFEKLKEVNQYMLLKSFTKRI